MTKSHTPSPASSSFSAGLTELEQITAWFEGDATNLDEGVAKFERGLALIAELRGQLTAVENRVEKIRADFSAGSQTSRPQSANGPTPETESETEPETKAEAPQAVSSSDDSSPALFSL